MYKIYFLLCILMTSVIKSKENAELYNPINGFLQNLSKLTAIKSFDEQLDDFVRNPENAETLRKNKLTYFSTHSHVLSSDEYAAVKQAETVKLSEINELKLKIVNNKVYPYTNSLLFHEDQYRFDVKGQTACLYSENGETPKEDNHYLTKEVGLIYHTPEAFNSNCFKVVSQEIQSGQVELPNGLTQILPFVKTETSIITGTPTTKDLHKKRNLAILGCVSLLAALACVNFEAYNAIISLS